MHAVKLEELERRLRNDLMHEAMAWGGRLLLHRDIQPQGQAKEQAESDGGRKMDDITTNEDVNPDTAIAAFWDSAGKEALGRLTSLTCASCGDPKVAMRICACRSGS